MIEAQLTSRPSVTQFYGSQLKKIEAKTRITPNAAKYLDPLSTGLLSLDWVMNGGIYNGMCTALGTEGSGKTTTVNHIIASSIKNELAFSLFFDAEGTLNPELASNIFKPFGVSLDMLADGSDEMSENPWKYYRNNVIEKTFDHMHMLLKVMPDKVWLPDEKLWAYMFPKRDDTAKKAMAAYGMKPVQSLNTDHAFVCPTEFSGLEGMFSIDSFAAMVTNSDDEDDGVSKIRAAEASMFSKHLRRISARLNAKGVAVMGINQLRESPNATKFSGPSWYAPGGKALGFYSSQRFTCTSRGSGFTNVDSKYDKEARHHTEPSIFVENGYDEYDYKHFRNTKNKPGNPDKEGLGSHMDFRSNNRVWTWL